MQEKIKKFTKIFFWLIIFPLITIGLVHYVFYHQPFTWPQANLENRKVLAVDNNTTSFLLDSYGANNSVITEKISDYGNLMGTDTTLLAYTLVGSSTVVFIITTPNKFLIYKLEKNQKPILIKTLALYNLNDWNDGYKAGKNVFSQDLSEGTIAMNNLYLEPSGSDMFSFLDIAITGVDKDGVSELTERKRTFDLSGKEVEREREFSKNNLSAEYYNYKSELQKNPYVKLYYKNFGISDWNNIANFYHETLSHGLGEVFGIFTVGNSNYDIYTKHLNIIGDQMSCDAGGSILASPILPYICFMWYQDSLVLDKKTNDSATTTQTLARSATMAYLGVYNTHSIIVNKLSNDRKIVMVTFKNFVLWGGEQDDYYAYDLLSGKFAKLKHLGNMY